METKIESFIFNFLEEMPEVISQEEKSLVMLDKLAEDFPDLSGRIAEISDSFIHLNSILRNQFFGWGILFGKTWQNYETD